MRREGGIIIPSGGKDLKAAVQELATNNSGRCIYNKKEQDGFSLTNYLARALPTRTVELICIPVI